MTPSHVYVSHTRLTLVRVAIKSGAKGCTQLRASAELLEEDTLARSCCAELIVVNASSVCK